MKFPDELRKIQIYVYIPKPLKERADKQGRREGRSISNLAAKALEFYLDKKEENEKT